MKRKISLGLETNIRQVDSSDVHRPMMDVTTLAFGLLLAYGFTSVGSQAGNITLTCWSCHNALTLKDCIGKETCTENEQCYMDELITEELRVIFNGGCRSSSVCRRSGKRMERSDMLACSRCCGNELQNSGLSVLNIECNANLCGIKPDKETIRCRSCIDARTLDDCTGNVSCGLNEECYMDQYITSDLRIFYNGGCRSTNACTHTPRSVWGVNYRHTCSQCCNTPPQHSSSSHSDMECNTMLCGINAADITTLRCRRCLNARTLDDCSGHVICGQNEICYTEEIITSDLRVVFNAGCKLTQVCHNSPHFGRAASDGMIACSRCCNTPPQNSSFSHSDMECNSMLCGFKSAVSCYHCQNHQGTDHPNQCYNKTVCPSDEVCRATTYNIGGNTTHSFGCYNKLKCQLLNKVALIQYGPSSIDLGLSNGIGRKRQSIVCDVCCGENYCNNAECHIVRERLIGYANASRLDYDTLRLKP